MRSIICIAGVAATLTLQTYAFPPAQSQNSTFNSTQVVTADQISRYSLNQSWADAISIALQFEQSNWAYGSVRSDPFYVPPPTSKDAAPGTLLAVQEHVNLSQYTVAPNVAMSKILFQSETFNGSAVPASAYVIWPYVAQQFSLTQDKLPVVGWLHGTCGWSAECAPSHLRNLNYHFAAPFELALEGYVVVAPDYVGLGVGTDADGDVIPNQYMAHPVAANDLAFALQAAQQAWTQLSREFVVFGHSLGAGAAWAFAQRQVETPVDGYLGTVAVSPVGSLIDEGAYQPSPFQRIATTAQGVSSIFPEFQLSDWLTERGALSIELQLELQGCNPVAVELLGGADTVQPNWNSTWSARAFSDLTGIGGRPLQGPMLVMQGSKDANVPIQLTNYNVNRTCALGDIDLEYHTYEGVEHVPTLWANRRVFQYWIRDRFLGLPIESGCRTVAETPVRPVVDYSQSYNWFIERAQYAYETS